MLQFARCVYECGQGYLKAASDERTLSGRVQKNLAGRILTLVGALFLHAEMVNKAVQVCFLHLREVFSPSNQDQLRKKEQEFALAMHLMRSFFATSHPKTPVELPEQPNPEEAPQAGQAPPVVLIPEPIGEEQPLAPEPTTLPHSEREDTTPSDFSVVSTPTELRSPRPESQPHIPPAAAVVNDPRKSNPLPPGFIKKTPSDFSVVSTPQSQPLISPNDSSTSNFVIQD